MSNNFAFQPVNRHIHISPEEEENQTISGVLLPEDYNPDRQKYVTAKVISISPDCSSVVKEALSNGSKIVVDKSMTEEITLSGQKFHVILENYIIGSLRENNEN